IRGFDSRPHLSRAGFDSTESSENLRGVVIPQGSLHCFPLSANHGFHDGPRKPEVEGIGKAAPDSTSISSSMPRDWLRAMSQRPSGDQSMPRSYQLAGS